MKDEEGILKKEVFYIKKKTIKGGDTLDTLEEKLYKPGSVLDEYQEIIPIKEHRERFPIPFSLGVGTGLLGSYLGKIASGLQLVRDPVGSVCGAFLGFWSGLLAYAELRNYLNNRKLQKFKEECKKRNINTLHRACASPSRYQKVIGFNTYLALDKDKKKAILYKGEDTSLGIPRNVKDELIDEFEIKTLLLPEKDLDRLAKILQKS